MYSFSSIATRDQVSSEDVTSLLVLKLRSLFLKQKKWQNITHFGPCSGYKHVKLLLKSLIIYS